MYVRSMHAVPCVLCVTLRFDKLQATTYIMIRMIRAHGITMCNKNTTMMNQMFVVVVCVVGALKRRQSGRKATEYQPESRERVRSLAHS